MERTDDGPAAAIVGILGWAVFLACSWTWCIGMYLPVLLVRDLGVWAWVIFAVPNIVGASAMGWMLRRPDASQRLVDRHGGACLWFSVVTIAFHVFFVGWMVRGLLGLVGVFTFVAAAAVVLALRRDVLMAAITFTFSLAAATFLLGRGELFAPVTPPTDTARLPADLAGLAAVSCLGFLLCPYLDLTFHRARQSTGEPAGSLAFIAGFAGPFLLMILFTLGYVALLTQGNSTLGLRVVGLHMAIQSGFTVALHLRAIRQASVERWPWAAVLVAAAVSVLLAIVADRIAAMSGRTGGEVIYRCFMVFYGLVFPAYVWLMVAGRSAPRGMGLALLLAAIAAALPFYAMGFLLGPVAAVLPGVALVAVAGLGRMAALRSCGGGGEE